MDASSSAGQAQLFDCIINSNQTGVCVFDAVRDAVGTFLCFCPSYINPAGAAMLGKHPEKLIGAGYQAHFRRRRAVVCWPFTELCWKVGNRRACWKYLMRITIQCQLVAAADIADTVRIVCQTVKYHQIDIIDTGIGFEEKYLDRIFQVFQRLPSRSEFSGTGIGLAICEKVVANHGGAITAASQLNQGTTFRVYLPA